MRHCRSGTGRAPCGGACSGGYLRLSELRGRRFRPDAADQTIGEIHTCTAFIARSCRPGRKQGNCCILIALLRYRPPQAARRLIKLQSIQPTAKCSPTRSKARSIQVRSRQMACPFPASCRRRNNYSMTPTSRLDRVLVWPMTFLATVKRLFVLASVSSTAVHSA